MPKLPDSPRFFLTIEGLLAAMKRGDLSISDLAGGVYYLNLPRDQVLDPARAPVNYLTQYYSSDPNLGKLHHTMLLAAIRTAEADGRAIWHPTPPKDGKPMVNTVVHLIEMFERKVDYALCTPDMVEALKSQDQFAHIPVTMAARLVGAAGFIPVY